MAARVGRRVVARVARGGARCGPAGALEPPASVAEAVSSLTIADAFVEAGESPGPAPSAPTPPRRFICSFPDCSASYNKAWKLEAHLCKHSGEVGPGGPVRRAEASLQGVSAGAPLGCGKIPSRAPLRTPSLFHILPLDPGVPK